MPSHVHVFLRLHEQLGLGVLSELMFRVLLGQDLFCKLWIVPLLTGMSELSDKDRKDLESQLKAREDLLLPIYHQVAVQFADLHDTPGRMLEKGVISVRAGSFVAACEWPILRSPGFQQMEEIWVQTLHIRIAWGALKYPSAQVALQTNEIRISKMGARHQYIFFQIPKRF